MDCTGIDILLIEDNIDDATFILRLFEKAGYKNKILHFHDSEVAEAILKEPFKYNCKPQLILLDLKMPKLDGFDIIKVCKGNSSLQNIPVVVFTSSAEAGDIEKATLIGADGYEVKPIDYILFKTSVERIINEWLLSK